jgi:ribosomal protein S6
LDILKVANKGKHFYVFEIHYKAAKCKEALKEKYVFEYNVILYLVIEKDKRQKTNKRMMAHLCFHQDIQWLHRIRAAVLRSVGLHIHHCSYW